MKNYVYGFLLLMIYLLTGFKSAEIKRTEIEYAGLNCVVVEGKNAENIMELFQQMQAEGEREGYCPLIILRDEQTSGGRSVLDEWLEMQAEDYGSLTEYTQLLLSEYKDIEAEDYFDTKSELYLEYIQWENGEGQSYITGNPDVEPQNELYISYVEDIYIAKVPTDKPYEVLAYIPMGGYNDCPPTQEHMAIAKKWYEEYGAVPCAVSYDIVQYYLDIPVTEDAALEKLKKEQFIYCYDIVLQGVGSIENLMRSLDGSRFWFFWWD